MERVEVSAVLDIEPTSVKATLSPRTILTHERTHEVVNVTETGQNTWEVLAIAPKEDNDAIFTFERTVNGYTYELVEEGFFEELRTSITVSPVEDNEGSSRTDLSIKSSYTFGGIWARIFDPRASDNRRKELTRLRDGLSKELDAAVVDTD